MTQSEYARLVAQIAVLKEVAEEYPGKTIENIIVQLEARKREVCNAGQSRKQQEKLKEHKTMSEFGNLKVGDKVIVSERIRGERRYERIENVTRITDRQIVIGNKRYWKKNGKESGLVIGSFGSHLVIATEERIKQIDGKKKGVG